MRAKQKSIKVKFHIGCLYLACAVFVSSAFLAADFAHTDDVVYNEISSGNVLTTDSMRDSESPYDNVEGDRLVIGTGEGLKVFSGDIDLSKADAVGINFTVVNNSDTKTNLHVDLYGADYDDKYNEFTVKVKPGQKKVSKEIAFYRSDHPESCAVRIFTSDNADLEIRDLDIDYLTATKDSSRLVKNAVRIMQVLMTISLLFLVCYISYGIKIKELTIRRKSKPGSSDMVKEVTLYASVVLSVTAVLTILYRKADISFPLIYNGGDEMGVFYYAKIIDKNGLSLVNPLAGGLSGGDMFDYPYSDKLSFLLVKLIGAFTDNSYLIINLFYFLCFYLIAAIAAAVSRKMGASRVNALMVGTLFAFSPYIQMRYTHMWLVPYFMIPVACLLSMNIIKGSLPDETDPAKYERRLWNNIAMAFLCAFTGMYYAYFSCALFAAAMVIRIINTKGKSIRKELYPLGYIASTVIGVTINVMPNLLYWRMFGTNPYSELSGRNRGDVESYALKLVQMILPRPGHRLPLFSRIIEGYNRNYPLVTENMTAAIGIVATAGLLISLLLLFTDRNKYKEISYLNLSIFIIATIGGIGSIISVAIVIPMRCYNRMSLIIMFLSLMMIGLLLDRLRDYINYVPVTIVTLCILAIGLFDQTADYYPYDYTAFSNTQSFFQQIENETDNKDMIFTLPYDSWPTAGIVGSYDQFIGYMETEDLRWSYGAMQGREEALWQKFISKCDIPEMIERLKYAGYKAIYLNKALYESKYGEERTDEVINAISETAGKNPLKSSDENRYFWIIDSNNSSNIQ